MSRAITQPQPPLNLPLDQVQHVVLEGVSWGSYEKLLKEIGDRPLRVTFDEGSLEIMSPLPEHERPKRFIGRLLEMLAFELDMPVTCFGSTTFRRRDKQKGLEPDECYFFENEAKARGLKRWNPKSDPSPDLVVEVDIFSRSIDREPIYAALGVPEIWRYDGRRLQCLQLTGDHYSVRRCSKVFPFLEVAQLQQFIAQLPEKDENTILREFLSWVKKNGWA